MDLGFNLGVVVVCFSIVFLVLIGLSYIIVLQRAILKGFDKKEKPEDKDKGHALIETQLEEVPAAEEDTDEIIAVVTAAVTAMLGKPSSQIKIKSIRRAGQSNQSWVMSGRRDLMDSRY